MNPTNDQLIAANRAARDADSEWRNQFHKAFGDRPTVALFSDRGKGVDNPKSNLAKAWNYPIICTATSLQLMDARIAYVSDSQASPCPTPSTPAT